MSNLYQSVVSIGLYRHFKGEYYYVKGLAEDCTTNKVYVEYFNVCHPEYGTFVRPLEDFITEKWEYTVEDDPNSSTCVVCKDYIANRPDNVTGQHKRFERVYDLNFQLGSVSTQTLIEELRGRADSPLQDVAYYGLSDLVAYKDYCVGTECPATDTTPYGIVTEASFDDKIKALKYFHTHKHNKNTGIFRRVFVREEK